MEPLRWNEAKPKDHRTKHENQACLVADKGLDVANYSRASGEGRRMFLTSPLIDQAFAFIDFVEQPRDIGSLKPSRRCVLASKHQFFMSTKEEP